MYLSNAADGRRIVHWRNFFRQRPLIKQHSAPLKIINPRFYSFTARKSGVGCYLYFDVLNEGVVPVHSFAKSHSSIYFADNGSSGTRPESPLLQGETCTPIISISGTDRLTLSIDFIQFADGSILFTSPDQKTAHPDGVRAGIEAARKHLRRILEMKGAAEVMKLLPRIHAEVTDEMKSVHYWGHGFYYGVTNVEVLLCKAYEESKLAGVEAMLRVK